MVPNYSVGQPVIQSVSQLTSPSIQSCKALKDFLDDDSEHVPNGL